MESTLFSKFMDTENVQKFKSISNTTKIENLSDKYQIFNSKNVIENFENFGFKPIFIKETKSRNPENQKFKKHLITFANSEIKLGEYVPTIQYLNSHDGTSKVSFFVGIFRLICENGLMVKNQAISNFEARHFENSLQTFNNIFDEAKEKTLLLEEQIKSFQKTILSISEAQNFVDKVMNQIIDTNIYDYNYEELLKPNRIQDEENNLWIYLNRIQENIIRGNYIRTNIEKQKTFRSRKIKAIDREIEINTNVWNSALDFIQ